MKECPNCGELLNTNDLENEFCAHCLADLDVDEINERQFEIEDEDIIFDDDDF